MGLLLQVLFLSTHKKDHYEWAVLIFTMKAVVAFYRKFMGVKDQFQWYVHQRPNHRIEVLFLIN